MRSLLAAALIAAAPISVLAADRPIATHGDLNYRSAIGLCVERTAATNPRLTGEAVLGMCECSHNGQQRVFQQISSRVPDKPLSQWSPAEIASAEAAMQPALLGMLQTCAAQNGIDFSKLAPPAR